MVTIWFETHATTLDNEAKLSSGWYDSKLSELGLRQAKELAERWKGRKADYVFSSDMERAHKTAQIAFGADTRKVLADWRLRECNYGDLTHKSSELVDSEKPKRVREAFPNGESYEDCARRMKSFLDDLRADFDGKTVVVVGHRATQFGLEHWLDGKSLEDCVTEAWKWQPGWKYELK